MGRKEDEQLRAFITKKLEIERMPPEFWRMATEKGMTQGLVASLREGLRQGMRLEDIALSTSDCDAIGDLRRDLDFFMLGRPPVPETPADRAVEPFPEEDFALTPAEQARARANSFLQAAWASQDKRIIDFRDTYQGGVLLRQDLLWDLLDRQRLIKRQAWEAYAHEPLLPYYDRSGGLSHARYDKNSMLAALHGLALSLAEDYPWTVAGAVQFVITGLLPFAWPIRVALQARAVAPFTPRTITLQIEPWIAPDRVREAYVQEQQLLLPQGRKHAKTWGKQGAARTYVVLAFVLQHLYSTGTPIDFSRPPHADATMYAAWQTHCRSVDLRHTYGERDVAEFAYKEPGGLKLFQQDVRRAWHSLVGAG